MTNQLHSIKDACKKIVSGGTPLRSNPEYYKNGAIPWLKTGDIKKNFIYEVEEFISEKGLENSSAKLIPKNSVLVAMYGDGNTAGSVAVNKIELATNQACCNLIIDQRRANYLYVYYYLKASYNNLVGLKLGGSQQNLNAKIIRDFSIWLPNLKNQQKIAAILSAYDELIENNKRRIALLEKMAEEIYREWFVRFRFPGYQTAEFEKGIPKGWVQTRFDDFCVLKRGYDLPDSQIEPGDYPVIASTSIKTYHKFYKVTPPVITTGRSGSLGTVLINWKKSWPLNTSLYVKNTKGNSIYLIYYTLKNMKLENFNSGAGVPSLNRNHLASLKLFVPAKNIQSEFDKIIRPIFEEKENLIEQIAVLNKIKENLLPRLISGKLSVEHLNIQFPPSMQEDRTA